MCMSNEFTLGADPEFPLIDNITGEFVSAIDKLGGTKENPRLISLYGHVQEDNTLAEINTVPAHNKDEWLQNVINLINDTDSLLADRNLSLGYSDVIYYDESVFYDPRANIFGIEFIIFT